MVYSRSTEYAIRAFVYLAQVPEGKYAMVRQIAAAEKIPAHFLAKILQQMVRKGLLYSNKGPTGGFCLRVPPKKITLMRLIEALNGLTDYQKCVSGLSECTDEAPCGMHDSWKTLRRRIIRYLETTTIAELVVSLEAKRRLMEKPRRARGHAAARK